MKDTTTSSLCRSCTHRNVCSKVESIVTTFNEYGDALTCFWYDKDSVDCQPPLNVENITTTIIEGLSAEGFEIKNNNITYDSIILENPTENTRVKITIESE